jgi:hexosaminidase
MKLDLFPIPRKIIVKEQSVDLSSKKWIFVDSSFSSKLKKHVNKFASSINDLFIRTPQLSSKIKKDGKSLLKISLDASKLSPQGYSISVDKRGIAINAADESGAFYAIITLKQILKQTGSEVPEFRISDFPDFDQRGMMLDISRCKVPTMDSLKKYIDLLASLKFNQLQLYTEHTFAYHSHETVWFDSSPMTSEEILEIDKYCSGNYIQLVPNFNSFGHFERWLKHPEYKHLAECPEGFETPWGGRAESGGVLYPDKKSLDFIDSLYGEFLPNFSSALFNIGCDETWELGQGRSKKVTDKHGTEKIYFDFLLKLIKLVKKHKRKMMFWGDIILKKPELIKELPKDIIALNWGYEADHPYKEECAKFAKADVPFYVCPGTSSWNSLIGVWEKARKNLANAAKNGLKYGAEGYLITDWGDGGHHQYLPISYPGILTGACFSWCFKANLDVDTAKGLDMLIFSDKKEILGQLLLDISNVQNCIPVKKGNSSIFGKMLFAQNKELKEIFKSVPRCDFEKAISSFDTLKKRIQGAQPHTSDACLIKEEIAASIEMAKFATLKTIFVLWPEKEQSIELKHKIQHIIRIHEELWLARNRHGGLRESSDRLRQIFDLDKCTE